MKPCFWCFRLSSPAFFSLNIYKSSLLSVVYAFVSVFFFPLQLLIFGWNATTFFLVTIISRCLTRGLGGNFWNEEGKRNKYLPICFWWWLLESKILTACKISWTFSVNSSACFCFSVWLWLWIGLCLCECVCCFNCGPVCEWDFSILYVRENLFSCFTLNSCTFCSLTITSFYIAFLLFFLQ